MISFQVKDCKMQIDEKKIAKLRNDLNTVKSQLDTIFLNQRAPKIISDITDPFKYKKRKIAFAGNTYNITNAWLKCYEIISYYKLITPSDNFIHFDNASFPGSFILASHHYAHTICKTNYQWKGCSLINNADSKILKDTYKLFSNYPDNWLMDDKNNGDLTDINNILDIKNKLNQQVDLYTSDLGFDVSNDYNNQEIIHMSANLGQILCGILTLKDGGNMVVKHFTYFEPFTLFYLEKLRLLFNNLYICKPISSKSTNSEVYIIGKNFTYNINVVNELLMLFEKKIKYSDISSCFLSNAYTSARLIYGKQIFYLKKTIKCFNKITDNKQSRLKTYNTINKNNNRIYQIWIKTYPIKPLYIHLNHRDAYHQK